jgi:hypothetical protein
VGALLIVPVVVGASLLPSFTATNTVPTSRLGRSSHGLLLAQYIPAQCQALGITNAIVATGASAFGTSQNDLIIGRGYTGYVYYWGGGGNDCIVAGGQAGTTNLLDGGTGTNVCIAPAAATNVRQRCT